MDKANGDAPFIPLYGTAVPGAGLGRLAGLPAAGLRLHRGQAARPPLSFSSFTVGKRPAGRRWSCASAKGSAAVSPLTTFPCCRHSSGWIASPPSPFGGFPPAPPGCPWSPQDDGRW